MIRRPPSSPLFPSTPLSRSLGGRPLVDGRASGALIEDHQPARLQPQPREVPVELPEPLRARVLAPLPRHLQLHRHRSEEHTSELQSQSNLVCRLLLEKKTNK